MALAAQNSTAASRTTLKKTILGGPFRAVWSSNSLHGRRVNVRLDSIGYARGCSTIVTARTLLFISERNFITVALQELRVTQVAPTQHGDEALHTPRQHPRESIRDSFGQMARKAHTSPRSFEDM